ncbi:hypothetical protein D3C86_1776790 [compost metagenome]
MRAQATKSSYSLPFCHCGSEASRKKFALMRPAALSKPAGCRTPPIELDALIR